MLPITKQLNNVTRRPVPAPATIRPAGRKRKSSSAWENRTSHCSRSFSGATSARATRRQLSSIVTSIGVPSCAFSRYLASQICREIGAILIAMPAASGSGPRQSPDRGPGMAGAGSSAVMYISIVLSWSSVCPSPSPRDAGRGRGAAAGAPLPPQGQAVRDGPLRRPAARGTRLDHCSAMPFYGGLAECSADQNRCSNSAALRLSTRLRTGTGAATGWCSQPATRFRSGMSSRNNDGVAGPRR